MTRPFRLTAEHAKERAEHRTLAKWLRVMIGEPATDGYCGTMWFSIDHATSGSDGERIDRWNRGVRRGVPDVIFVRPRGVTYWIELKRIGEDARKDQELLHQRLRSRSHFVAVCEGANDAIKQLEKWGVPLRGRVTA